MKLLNYSFRLMPAFAAAILICVAAACGSRKNIPAQHPEVAAINDTLRFGKVRAGMLLTDSLKHRALREGDSLTWSEAMVQQGVNYYYIGQPERLIESTDSAITWLRRQPLTPKIAMVLSKAYQTHGAFYDQFSFNPDSLAHYLRLSVDNMEIAGHRESLPLHYGNYANALRAGATLDSAAIYYHRAISIADSLEMAPIHYIPLYNGIASVFTDMRDFTNSGIWWEKSMELLPTMNYFDRFNTLTGYGNDLYYREDYAAANMVFLRLKEMLDTIPDTRWERMFTAVNLADTYIRLGATGNSKSDSSILHGMQPIVMLDSAARYFSEEQPNPVATSYIHTIRMRGLLVDGDLAAASALDRAHPVADTLRLEQLLARLLALEELYSRTGDFHRAYDVKSRYDRLNDSLRSSQLRQQISAMNATYQRDKRIFNLETANSRKQAHIYRLVAMIGISVAVIVALVLILIVRRQRMRRREGRMMDKIVSLRQENLRNRVTPHFIYNALNHELNNAGSGKPSHLDAMVRLIRRQQFVASEMLIPFADELEFVNDYVSVVGDNGRDPLDYSCEIGEGISTDFMFPSMALQILVENAFKHGFPSLPQGETRHLTIKVNREGEGRIVVTVFNNSGTESSSTKGTGTGMRVLVETIRIINERNKAKTEFTIKTASTYEGLRGCTAVISIPDTLH